MTQRPRILVANHSGFPVNLPTGPDAETRHRAIRWAVEAQVRAGLDIVTDGQVGLRNPLEPLVAALGGLESSSSVVQVPAWGEVNVPVLTGPVRWDGPIFEDALTLAQDLAGRPVKVAMAGPYSLARLAQDPDRVYDSLGARIEACAKALTEEVRSLATLGAAVIQIEEPVILGRTSDFPRLQRALATLAEARGPSQLALMLTGDAICPLYDWLQSLPVDVLGLDLVHSPRLVNMVGDRETSLTLSLGLLNPEAMALETADRIFAALDRMLPGISAPEVHVQPAGTLAHLSPEMAHSKLANLAVLVREYRALNSSRL